MKKEPTKSYIVSMECVVRKDVITFSCTEDQARNDPWDYVESEIEIDQVDWKVISIMENT